MTEHRKVIICGVPYSMSIVDGCVLFSNKSGFYGVGMRFLFEYRCNLWHFESSATTWGSVPACHLAQMHEKLEEMISPDHTEADGSVFTLRFAKEDSDD